MRKIDFFIKAQEERLTLYRNKPSCKCTGCFNALKLGIVPTTFDDVKRLFNEQQKYDIVFSLEAPDYGTVFKDRRKSTSKQVRAEMLRANKERLERLLMK